MFLLSLCQGSGCITYTQAELAPLMNARARAILKSTAPVVARYSGIAKALALRYAGRGTIFLLHSIGRTFFPDELLSCPASVLEDALCWLKNNRICVVSLDVALERLRGSSTEKFCVLTFDDGFADNLTYALPIMERYEAPFTVYVTDGMLNGDIDAWWLGLAALIRTRDRVELPELGCRFDCEDRASKKRTFAAIRSLIALNWETLAAVKAAIAANGIDYHALARAEGLSTEQLRLLAASPLVTIGAHGARHINLARASEAEAEQEMTASRRLLEGIIGREVVHFAYAFGDCGPREARIAQRVGFRSAVTTLRGTLFPEHLNHLHALPREPLDRNDTPSTLRCKVDGTYRAFYSWLGDPIAHL